MKRLRAEFRPLSKLECTNVSVVCLNVLKMAIKETPKKYVVSELVGHSETC